MRRSSPGEGRGCTLTCEAIHTHTVSMMFEKLSSPGAVPAATAPVFNNHADCINQKARTLQKSTSSIRRNPLYSKKRVSSQPGHLEEDSDVSSEDGSDFDPFTPSHVDQEVEVSEIDNVTTFCAEVCALLKCQACQDVGLRFSFELPDGTEL
jgi:hypothetical protein